MQSLLLHHLLSDHEESVDGDANVQSLGKDHGPVEGRKWKHHCPGLIEMLSAASEDQEAQNYCSTSIQCMGEKSAVMTERQRRVRQKKKK